MSHLHPIKGFFNTDIFEKGVHEPVKHLNNKAKEHIITEIDKSRQAHDNDEATILNNKYYDILIGDVIEGKLGFLDINDPNDKIKYYYSMKL
jgi:hypothetical protein